MAIENVSSLVGTMPLDSVLTRQIAEAQLGKHIVGTPTNNAALVQQAQDTYAAGSSKVNLKAQAPLGSQPSTASPHANYSHQAGQTGGTYFQALDSDKVALTDRTGQKVISGKHLGRVMNEADPKYVTSDNPQGFRFASLRKGMIEKHKLVQSADGRWLAPVQAPSAGNVGDMIPGLTSSANALSGGGQADIAQSGMNFLNRTSWMMPVMGLMAGGVGGMAGGFMVSQALKQGSAGSGLSGLNMAGLALGSGGMSGSSSLVSTMQAAKWGSYANIAQTMDGVGGITTAGLSHACRSIMNSHAREAKLDTLIRDIQNPGIPIEDLIFMFMAQMGEQYEGKLRDAMEKAAIAEKLEQRRERRKSEASVKSGLLGAVGSAASAIPIYGGIVKGVTDMAGKQIEMKAQRKSEMEGRVNANMESSTALMQKVQMLMHKWKQLNEMMSNLMKAMHDMAMTPIRNVR